MTLGRIIVIAILCIATPVVPARADPSARDDAKTRSEFLKGLSSKAGEIERYQYLISELPQLGTNDQDFARQFLSFSENELGLYSEAIRDFPLRNQLPAGVALPSLPEWESVNAVAVIAQMAADRNLVMVNEAHHDAHSRVLTLALLPILRKSGFTYFAAEALGDGDADLQKRGYAIKSSGSEYLSEPLYGDMIRLAIKLGYIIVPYESEAGSTQARESQQAKNLYDRVFKKNPNAKLFVHAGYAHIDKDVGRLGSVRPMAMELRRLVHYNALSIDQTDIREDSPMVEADAYREAAQQIENGRVKFDPAFISLLRMQGKPQRDAYHQIVGKYKPQYPVIFLNRDTGHYWSARPKAYDLSVILPIANENSSDYTIKPYNLMIDGRSHAVLPPASGGHRPSWLALDGERRRVAIDSQACERLYPCLVEARYSEETDNAIAADRYLFLGDDKNELYLRPGKYRLQVYAPDGKLLKERGIETN